MTRTRVEILHGPNFNVLERRPSNHYEGLTFSQFEVRLDQFAHASGLDARFFQTNHEGEFVEELHRVSDYADALVLNPGAWTHYSWAIHDALEIVDLPAVEVHLSDIKKREAFRQVSVISDLCIATISGRGIEGYRDAFELLAKQLA